MGKGIIVVISGPSGVGKGTIISELLKIMDAPCELSISWTTRKKRSGEVNGREYFFVSRKVFEEQIKKNGFLEWAEYAGNLYGTPMFYINKAIEQRKVIFLEIEVKGALKLIARGIKNMITIFLTVPSISYIEERLKNRNQNTELDIKKRLEVANFEFSQKNKYDYIVVNEDIKTATLEILDIIKKKISNTC